MGDTVIRQARGGSFAVDAEDDRIRREQVVEHVNPDLLGKGEFRALMQKIRAAYFAKRKTNVGDGPAFEALVEERGLYEADRWPLKHVVNALVRISERAKRLNATHFGRRFS